MNLSPRAIEAAAEKMGAKRAELQHLPLARIYKELAETGLSAALAVDGLCLVPCEPTAKVIAAAFPTEGERPPPGDMKIGAEAIMILEGGRDCGSITGLAVVEAASMCRDYRNLVAAASTGDSPRPENKK